MDCWHRATAKAVYPLASLAALQVIPGVLGTCRAITGKKWECHKGDPDAERAVQDCHGDYHTSANLFLPKHQPPLSSSTDRLCDST